jgi:hypothetical protein
MSVCTLLSFRSSAQAQSLEAGSTRSGDTQVLPFSTVIYRHLEASVREPKSDPRARPFWSDPSARLTLGSTTKEASASRASRHHLHDAPQGDKETD